MQLALAVKTLKGEKFTVNAEETNTIAEVKTIIVSAFAGRRWQETSCYRTSSAVVASLAFFTV